MTKFSKTLHLRELGEERKRGEATRKLQLHQVRI